MADRAHTYDIAVSFTGAQRELVEPIVRACEALGVKVFYDRDHTVDFWGRNFIADMRAIYGGTRVRYFVPFLSEEYLASGYPMDEFYAAMRRAIEPDVEGYILPILIGPVSVPPELLDPAIGFLRLEEHSTVEFARIIADRVDDARARHREPREVTVVVDEMLRVPLPRLPPAEFSAYETLETALARVGACFQRAAGELTRFGIRCLVRCSDSSLGVRVERQGAPVCGLRLRFDDAFGDDRLVMTFAWPRVTGGGFNGWITAEWDRDLRRPGLRFTELGRGEGRIVTADRLFELLWAKIIDRVEQVG